MRESNRQSAAPIDPIAFEVFEIWWPERSGPADLTALNRRLERADRVDVASWLELAPGSSFGPYRIEALAAHGGQASVYRASDPSLQRSVALKILHVHAAASASLRARFAREGRLVARLDHPDICPVLASGVIAERPYLVMPWLDGETLAAFRERLHRTEHDANVRAERALAIGDRLCAALRAAHAAGVLHRDLKPSNVMVDRTGAPKLLDFGIAADAAGDTTALTRTGDAFGTAGYMAPEQCGILSRTARPDERADQFALAAVLYELIAGRRPYAGDDLRSYERAVRAGRVADLGDTPLLRGISVVLKRALRLDPRERLASIEALQHELRRCLRGEPIHTRPLSWPARARSWARREPALAALTAAVMASLAIGLTAALAAMFDARTSAEVARWEAYRSGLAAAQARLSLGDLDAAIAELDRCPERERGWEWDHLRVAVDPSASRVAAGAGPPWTAVARRARDVRPLPNGDTVFVVATERSGDLELHALGRESDECRRLGVVPAPGPPPFALAHDGRGLWHAPAGGTLRLVALDGSARELHGPFGAVRRLAASGCGRYVAVFAGVGSAASVYVRRLGDGDDWRRVSGGHFRVEALRFDDGGSRLLVAAIGTAGASAALRIHAPGDGALLAERMASFVPAESAWFDPRDLGLVLPAADGTVHWFDAGLTRERAVTFGHAEGALVWGADDRAFAIDGGGALVSWRGSPPFATYRARLDEDLLAVAVAEDGEAYFGARSGRVWRFGAERAAPIAAGDRVVRVAVGGDACVVATPAALIEMARDGSNPRRHPLPRGWFATESAPRHRVAVLLRPGGTRDGTTGGELGWWAYGRAADAPEHGHTVPDVFAPHAAWAPARGPGRVAIAAGAAVRCIDFATARAADVPTPDGVRVRSVALGGDGERVLAGLDDGRVVLCDFGAADAGERRTVAIGKEPIRHVAWFPDGRRFAAATGGTVCVCSHQTGAVLVRLPGSGAPIQCLAVDRSGSHVAVGCQDGRVVVWSRGLPALGPVAADGEPTPPRSRPNLDALADAAGLTPSVYRWVQRRAVGDPAGARVTALLAGARAGSPDLAALRELSGLDPERGATSRFSFRAALALVLASHAAGAEAEARHAFAQIDAWARAREVTRDGPLWREAAAVLDGRPAAPVGDGRAVALLLPLCLARDLATDARRDLDRWLADRGRAVGWLRGVLAWRAGRFADAVAILDEARRGESLVHAGVVPCAVHALALAALGRGTEGASLATRVRIVAASDDHPERDEAAGFLPELVAAGY